VDGYLATEGAIAQAVDRHTILLRSSVFEMSPSDQLVLLSHELAHLQQLAQPGQDPVRALEDEAWEAAHAWMAGRTYRVRGRTRRRLDAIAIIQGGQRGHPAAPSWYEGNPVEPIGNGSTITVKDVTVTKDMTLDSVLDVIIQKKQTEVVVVCHGWSEGLALPLVAGSRMNGGAQKDQLFPLSADGNSKDQLDGGLRLPVRSDKDVADQARLFEDQVKALRVKMNQVRGLKLEHVAFRSCDMGLDVDTLQAFRNFFGAQSVSAPKKLDSYGAFTAESGAGVADWANLKRKRGFRLAMDRGVAFGTRRTDSALAYQIVCRAPDDKTFAAWVRAHVTDHVDRYRKVVYHGMMDLTVPASEAPYIYFVRDASFISNIVNYAGQSR
jgi:hypothetical protein